MRFPQVLAATLVLAVALLTGCHRTRPPAPGQVTTLDGAIHQCWDLRLVYETSLLGADRLEELQCWDDTVHGFTTSPGAALSWSGGIDVYR